jgi:hypothetical protein
MSTSPAGIGPRGSVTGRPHSVLDQAAPAPRWPEQSHRHLTARRDPHHHPCPYPDADAGLAAGGAAGPCPKGCPLLVLTRRRAADDLEGRKQLLATTQHAIAERGDCRTGADDPQGLPPSQRHDRGPDAALRAGLRDCQRWRSLVAANERRTGLAHQGGGEGRGEEAASAAGEAMSRIVTYVHRPKRPPRKKAQAAAITGPVIVLAGWTNARSDV